MAKSAKNAKRANPDGACRQEMMIGLAEQNDSGYSGIMWIGPSAGSTQTEISVILLEPAGTS